MKFSALVLVALLGIAETAWCDTIDFWHVYVNDSMVADLTTDSNVLTLSLKSVRAADSLKVEYFKDTPCWRCVTNLMVRNEKGIEKVVANGSETFEPLKVSLLDLLKAGNGSGYLEFYYFESDDGYKIKLFTLKLSA